MTVQRDDFWLKNASPDEIVRAQDAGELDDLLGRSRFPSTGQLTNEHLGRMSVEETREAFLEGRIDELFTGKGE